MGKYVVTVDDIEFKIEKASAEKLDISRLDDANFHLLQNNKAFAVKLLHANYDKKTMTLEVNGNSYSLKINDSYDQMVDKMGLLVGNSPKVKDIKAPMPGLIMEVMVKKGQEISEGTPLIILSAMKMENILLAQADGVIKAINVKQEDTVEKGQIIIEIE
jgi:biotin carboxyl carrier protein